MSFGRNAQAARLSVARLPVGAIEELDPLRILEVQELAEGAETGVAVETRDQFINVAPEPGRVGYGRRVRLRARVEWLSRNQKRPPAGQAVYWYFVAAQENRGGLPVPLRAGFGRPGQKTAATRVTESGWTEVAEFYLSQYGGDRFEVFATGDREGAGGVSAGHYTVWRRLYCELDGMERPAGGNYLDWLDAGEVEQRFRDIFVLLRRRGTDGAPAHRRLLTRKTAGEWAAHVRDGAGPPCYFHLCLVDTVASGRTELTEEYEVPPGGGSILLAADRYTLDPEGWFVAAEARQGSRQWPLDRARFHLSEEPAAYSIAVDLAELDLNRSAPVVLTLTFRTWSEVAALDAGPATLVGMRWREGAYRNSGLDIRTSTVHTILRAAARAMGMVPAVLPEGTPNENHTGMYSCSNSSCVMSEANATGTRFCPDCEDILRARNLSSLPIAPSAPY